MAPDSTDDRERRTDGVGSTPSDTFRPSITDAENTNSTAHGPQNNATPLDYAKALPVRVWILPVTLIALFLPWASISAPIIGHQSIAGIDTDSGLVILILLGLICGAELLWDGKRLKNVWMAGGTGILLVGVLSLFYIRSEMQSAMQDLQGNPFAAGVDMSLGLGLYLTILCGGLILFFGLQATKHMTSARMRVEGIKE